jgi:hypothetical protein
MTLEIFKHTINIKANYSKGVDYINYLLYTSIALLYEYKYSNDYLKI